MSKRNQQKKAALWFCATLVAGLAAIAVCILRLVQAPSYKVATILVMLLGIWWPALSRLANEMAEE